jgi:hypothetical protein
MENRKMGVGKRKIVILIPLMLFGATMMAQDVDPNSLPGKFGLTWDDVKTFWYMVGGVALVGFLAWITTKKKSPEKGAHHQPLVKRHHHHHRTHRVR